MADLSALSDDQLRALLAQAGPAAPQPAQAPAMPQPGAAPIDLQSMPTEEIQRLLSASAPAASPADSAPGFWESLGRGGMQGATFGGGDELYAAGAGAVAKARGEDFGPAYQRQLEETQRNNQAARQAHPWSYTAGEVLGSIPPMIAGGALPAVARVLGLTGSSLAGRTVAAGISGAGIGAGQGYLSTDGDNADRARGAFKGATWGAPLGAVGPAAGQAIGAGFRAAGETLTPGVAGVSKGAAVKLADDVAASGGGQAVLQRGRELGPQAMLLDASPSLQARAEGLAARPEAREILETPLAARDAGTNARLRETLDTNLGPAPIPSRVQAGLKADRQALGPAYEEALKDAKAVDTRAVADHLESLIPDSRGAIRQALESVRSDLNIPGNAGHLDPNPRALLGVRHSIDAINETAPDAVRKALKPIRDMVDGELTSKVPNIKAVDSKYAELMRQGEAFDRGATLLDRGRGAVHPADLADEIARNSLPHGELIGPSGVPARLRQGNRADLERVVGTNANDLAALRREVLSDGDWNIDKLAQLYGRDRAKALADAITRESTFRDTHQGVTRNSATARRTESAGEIRPRGDGGTTGDMGTVVATSVGGLPAAAMAVGARGLRAANNAVIRNSDLARNQELARLLAGPVDDRTAILLDSLDRTARAGRRTQAVSRRADALAQMLLETQGERVGEAMPARYQPW